MDDEFFDTCQWARDFFHWSVHTGCGANGAFRTLCTRSPFPGFKTVGPWSWVLTSIFRRYEWVELYLSPPPHVSTACTGVTVPCLYDDNKQHIYIYIGCPRRNVPDFGRVFLMLNYTDITQNTYVQIWTVTEILAREKCGLHWCRRTVRHPWRHTCPMRLPDN